MAHRVEIWIYIQLTLLPVAMCVASGVRRVAGAAEACAYHLVHPLGGAVGAVCVSELARALVAAAVYL